MLQVHSKHTWSSSLISCQLAVDPAQGEGGDVDGVVRVGDRQLGGVGYARAGRVPHWPGEVAVPGVPWGEVVVLVLAQSLLQAVLSVVLGVSEALQLLVRALQQGDALVLLAVDHLVPEGGVLLTADAAEQGGGWGSTWWGCRHLLSSSTIEQSLRHASLSRNAFRHCH